MSNNQSGVTPKTMSGMRQFATVAQAALAAVTPAEPGRIIMAPGLPSLIVTDPQETMTVTVRDRSREAPWGQGMTRVITAKIEISVLCQECGQRRGEPFGINSCDDGDYYWVQGWHNPCGHLDQYEDVIKEAVRLKELREDLAHDYAGEVRATARQAITAALGQEAPHAILSVRPDRDNPAALILHINRARNAQAAGDALLAAGYQVEHARELEAGVFRGGIKLRVLPGLPGGAR